LRQRFDLLLKALAAPCVLLLGVLSKIGQMFVFQLFVDQCAAKKGVRDNF
jgi:hypothetical protein